jgi:hypothetical protein
MLCQDRVNAPRPHLIPIPRRLTIGRERRQFANIAGAALHIGIFGVLLRLGRDQKLCRAIAVAHGVFAEHDAGIMNSETADVLRVRLERENLAAVVDGRLKDALDRFAKPGPTVDINLGVGINPLATLEDIGKTSDAGSAEQVTYKHLVSPRCWGGKLLWNCQT